MTRPTLSKYARKDCPDCEGEGEVVDAFETDRVGWDVMVVCHCVKSPRTKADVLRERGREAAKRIG